jgi:hypothetical protein
MQVGCNNFMVVCKVGTDFMGRWKHARRQSANDGMLFFVAELSCAFFDPLFQAKGWMRRKFRLFQKKILAGQAEFAVQVSV